MHITMYNFLQYDNFAHFLKIGYFSKNICPLEVLEQTSKKTKQKILYMVPDSTGVQNQTAKQKVIVHTLIRQV